ncbi:MAG: cell division protein [Gammaproteobacteria bacterium]|nr:MAG: cell division protein [Gammaproteobacteria bacterium]
MKKFVSPYGATPRRNFVLFLLGLFACTVLYRIVYLQTSKADDIIMRANDLFTRTVTEPASRGTIVDRNDIPLAVSTQVNSLWVNPHQFEQMPTEMHKLASVLGQSEKKLRKRLRANKYNSKGERINFVYVKRGLAPAKAKQITDSIPGVFSQSEYRRYYPAGDITAQIVGYNDPDQKGLAGIELLYNDWLSGTAGSSKIVRSVHGQVFEILEEIKPPVQGGNLKLTIDQRFQYLTYMALLEMAEKFSPKSATAVMLDAKTAEVLAMVSIPSGNPNNPKERRTSLLKNRAITDAFEPGSVMKAFAVAAALDAGLVSPYTPINTHPGYMKAHKNLVKDVHNYGRLNVSTVIKKSSNVGTCKIALRMPKIKLQNMYESLGLGQKSQIGFPGESAGIMHKITRMNDFDYCTNAYGYGISVTALQLAQAFAVIANDGVKIPATLEKREDALQPEGVRVMSARTARQVRKMLKSAVSEGGTGTQATTGDYMSDYTVGGKTGTVHKAIKGGYAKKKYRAIFAGMAPLSDPRIVMVVMVDEPKGKKYYGGEVAAPVFAKVVGKALRILGVAPDRKDMRKKNRIIETGFN